MLSLQQHTGYDGGSIQGRWTRSHSGNDESTLQFSYDKTKLDYPFAGALLNNFNAEFQNGGRRGNETKSTGERDTSNIGTARRRGEACGSFPSGPCIGSATW